MNSGRDSRATCTVVLVGSASREIAHPHVLVLEVFVHVGDVGRGLDDVGERRAGGFERGLDVLADLLDLGAHVALADAVAVAVARRLAGDEDLPRAADLDDHDLGIEDLVAGFADMQLVRLDAFAFGGTCYIFSTAGITSLVNSLSERMAVSNDMVPRKR